MTADPLDLMEDWLRAKTTKVKRKGDRIDACCPAHADSTPSLSVARGATRDIVVTCHAGCAPDAVMTALGHHWTELSPPRNITDGIEYPYRDADGRISYYVVRKPGKKFAQKRIDRVTGEVVWNMNGTERLLYRLPEVLAAKSAGETIYIVEGEKDANRMATAGVTATCNSGGAGKFTNNMADQLAGATVVIVADKDETGRQHADDVRAMLVARGCHVTVVEAAVGKDASDHLEAGKGIGDFVPMGITPDAVTDELADDDWAPIDLTGIAEEMINGTYEPTMPAILAVEGTFPLFYRERINSLFGESGGGKTWVSLIAVAEVVRNGGRAMFVDYEDHSKGITERLVLLGLTVAEIGRVDYRNPTTGIGRGIDAVTSGGITYDLVVIDSTGEAMASGAVDSNADGEVAQWFQLVKHYSRLPGQPAVVVLDHVPKDKEASNSYAIGSQRKRAAVTGAAYRVNTIKEPAKGRDGKLKLVVAKDRPGNRAKGTTAAIVDMRSMAHGLSITLHVDDAQAAAESGEKFRPTVLMERVSRYLEALPGGASQRTVEGGVTGKNEAIRLALECLVEEGYVTHDEKARRYTTVRIFRDGAVDNQQRAPRPERAPDAPQGAGQTPDSTAPRAPGPYTGARGAVELGADTDDSTIGAPAGAPPVDKSPLPLTAEEPF